MKVLITAFDPFNKSETNSSLEVLNSLNTENFDFWVKKLVVPTVFSKCTQCVMREIISFEPDVVILMGQAEGRKAITPEKVAINFKSATICDNQGNMPFDEKISEKGKTAYFSTLPIRAIEKKLNENNILSSISYSAGTFVCNSLFYGVMEECEKIDKKPSSIGFIHLPLSDSSKKEGIPFMEREKMTKGIELAIKEAVKALEK